MAVVVFLGVKHCGKSTQAALLAQKLNALLLDSDELLKTKYASEYSVGIEKAAPRAIMQRHGEEFFRRFEAGVIREFLKNKPEKPCVLALGGGVADNAFLTVGELKELGFLIFLKIDPEIAYKRIVVGGLPPFLQCDDPHGKFLQICQKRMPRCEELADLIVTIQGDGDPEDLAANIFAQLEERKVFEL